MSAPQGFIFCNFCSFTAALKKFAAQDILCLNSRRLSHALWQFRECTNSWKFRTLRRRSTTLMPSINRRNCSGELRGTAVKLICSNGCRASCYSYLRMSLLPVSVYSTVYISIPRDQNFVRITRRTLRVFFHRTICFLVT